MVPGNVPDIEIGGLIDFVSMPHASLDEPVDDHAHGGPAILDREVQGAVPRLVLEREEAAILAVPVLESREETTEMPGGHDGRAPRQADVGMVTEAVDLLGVPDAVDTGVGNRHLEGETTDGETRARLHADAGQCLTGF